MNKIIIILIVLLLFGCGIKAHRGDFQIVSTKNIENGFVTLSNKPVEGKACFGTVSIATGLPLPDNVIERAIDDAISKYPGAVYLVNLSFIDEGACFYVKGFPAKAK